MRSKINRWLFFLGLILSFAGLNSILLLSHLRETYPWVGPLLLALGIIALISANPDWRKSLWMRFPSRFQKLSDWLEMPKFIHLQGILVVILSLLSIFVLLDNIVSMFILLLVLVLSQALIIYLINSREKDKNKVWLVLEFQIFLVLSFLFVYHYLGSLIGWGTLSSELKETLFFLLWIIELTYLVPRIYQLYKPKKEEEKVVKTGEETPLAITVIDKLTLHGRLKRYLPIFGIFLIIATIAFNIFTSSSLDVGSHDGITYLFGIVLILYNYVPEEYALERDFSALFLLMLFVILVIPITIYAYIHGGMKESSNSPFIYYLLAEPTTYILNLLGMRATAVMNAGASGDWVMIRSMVLFSDGRRLTSLGIGLSCTGLYSVSIFISGYMGFVLTNYSEFNLKTLLFMGLGVFTAWFANVLRMAVIMITGYYYGMNALLWVHHYAGMFIFIAWISLFWGILFHFVDLSLILDYPTDKD